MAALVYATVGSNQLDVAKAFYDALLGSAGIKPVYGHPSGGRVYGANRTPNFAVPARMMANQRRLGTERCSSSGSIRAKRSMLSTQRH